MKRTASSRTASRAAAAASAALLAGLLTAPAPTAAVPYGLKCAEFMAQRAEQQRIVVLDILSSRGMISSASGTSAAALLSAKAGCQRNFSADVADFIG